MRPVNVGRTPEQLITLFAFAVLVFTSITCVNDEDGEQMPLIAKLVLAQLELM